MIYWERGTEVCGGSCRIGHLVYVEIIAPHWGGVLEKYICWWYALHSVERVLLKRKALGLYWDVNSAIFSITHTQPCLSHLCLFEINLIVKEDPTLNFSWELRKARVQLLELIGAMHRQKNDVPTNILSQEHKKTIARGREKSLKVFSQERKNTAASQPLLWYR